MMSKRVSPGQFRRVSLTLAALLLAALGPALSATFRAHAAPAAVVPVTLPPSTQFDLSGFIQQATLDPSCATNAHCGGSLTVNGHTVVIPKETIVILPASALTWQELFTQAPAPYSGNATGLAMADSPTPIATYEVNVIGNRVGNTYIAGLVHIAQQDLNGGAGYINFIDYSTGELRVGGTPGDANSGARVRINDPTGRFGRVMSPDQRFTVDPDNPTIASATGFPMCLPRTDPASADDALCPQGNRPIDPATGAFAANFQMNDPALGSTLLDANRQAPLEVGDYVTFAGTLVNDSATPTQAVPGASTYISAHTIIDNTAIYTAPGTNPAYVSIEVGLIGTGGLTVLGAGEAAIRTRFEGMTTDPTRNIHLYGIDLNPLDGSTSDRDWGTIGVDPGAPNGAVKGRWRYRPPCTATPGTVSDKKCSPPPTGSFLPPTREVRAVIEGAFTAPISAASPTAANGIVWGQYHAPIGEYIFPENIPGAPIVENNFNTIDFLALGGYTSAAGTLVGQLNPWPSNITPTPACVAPVANAGGPYSVASGGSITLAGSATGSSPLSFSWAAPAQGSLSSTTVANPVYSAPLVAATTTVNLALSVTNACGSATANTTITINAAAQPTVNHIAPQTVVSGAAVTLTASGSDPAGLPLTFSWQQTAGPTVLSPNPKAGATQSFIAPTAPQCPAASLVLNFSVTATNSAGVSSTPEFTSVTVNPLPDALSITNADYRTGKQRLDITATSSIVCPSLTVTLQPYRTVTGATFNPATLGAVFTNTGGGIYTLTLVGAPEPAIPPATPLTIKSNLNGTSPAHGLDRIRA